MRKNKAAERGHAAAVAPLVEPYRLATLPPEQRFAVDVLRTIGAHDLLRRIGPAGAARMLEEDARTFADVSEAELERLAAGEPPAAVLGAERAHRLNLGEP